ncbi:MAG TPA: sulfur oxidation c-type cytochrome SoxX [Methylibium sp.]|nr:sulfur oxidation c-type cytochrome SoxX [Methylibium sp.]
MKKTLLTLAAAAFVIAGCAALQPMPSPQELDARAQAVIQASFRDQGIAKVERLNQDLGQKACSSDKPPSEAVARQVESAALAGVKWPAGGQYLGDWKEGEKLAQNGRGMTWTDASADPKGNGGSCYNCHQIGKAELSFGSIGPSLYNYGKLRGVADPYDPKSAAIVQYTWAKLWNSKAYAACSNMPRFGHSALLNEDQIRHVMALLLDPKSPVNQ